MERAGHVEQGEGEGLQKPILSKQPDTYHVLLAFKPEPSLFVSRSGAPTQQTTSPSLIQPPSTTNPTHTNTHNSEPCPLYQQPAPPRRPQQGLSFDQTWRNLLRRQSLRGGFLPSFAHQAPFDIGGAYGLYEAAWREPGSEGLLSRD